MLYVFISTISFFFGVLLGVAACKRYYQQQCKETIANIETQITNYNAYKDKYLQTFFQKLSLEMSVMAYDIAKNSEDSTPESFMRKFNNMTCEYLESEMSFKNYLFSIGIDDEYDDLIELINNQENV